MPVGDELFQAAAAVGVPGGGREVGGAGRWALLQIMGDWQYEDPTSNDDREVWLWESDQGYACRGKNVLTDVEKVLRIVRKFYESGSYAGLDAVD